MEKVAMINELYFEEKKTLTEIAEVINTSVSYISKILIQRRKRKTKEWKLIKKKKDTKRFNLW